MSYFGAFGYGNNLGGSGNEDFSGGAYNPRYHFQAAQNAGFAVGTADANPRTLYVGNLDPSITEEFIATLFGQIGIISKAKIIFDLNSDPYAFVEFADHYGASQALTAMNGRTLLDRQIKVNWAVQPSPIVKTDTSKHFHVFVGDLSPEVDNKTLQEAFAPFGSISDAKVIKDPVTLKSKGYGFVSYPKREEAERAIEQMNGQWLGRRTIRTNWATRKPVSDGSGGYGTYQAKPRFEDVMSQTGPENTSVYVGNASPNATEEDFRKEFSRFGKVTDIRHFKPQGYAFIKLDTKEAAARAIIELSGTEICDQTIKCSWGKTEQTLPSYVPGSIFGAITSPTMARAPGPASAAASFDATQQQYWSYYQQYYNNPQMQQAWASYYQQPGGDKK